MTTQPDPSIVDSDSIVIRFVSSNLEDYPAEEFFLQLRVLQGAIDKLNEEGIFPLTLTQNDIKVASDENCFNIFCLKELLDITTVDKVDVRAFVQKLDVPCKESESFQALQIVAGSVRIETESETGFYDNNAKIWGNVIDTISQIGLTSNYLEFSIRRNQEKHQIRHIAKSDKHKNGIQYRFWELTSCGNLLPLEMIEIQLKRIGLGIKQDQAQTSGNQTIIKSIPVSESRPRYIFRSQYQEQTESQANVYELMQPGISLEYSEFENRPRWTPKRLEIERLVLESSLPSERTNFIFTDFELFELSTISFDPTSPQDLAPGVEVTWKKSEDGYSLSIDTNDMELTLSSANTNGNLSELLWQHCVVSTDPDVLGWVGIPLPLVEPPLVHTDPRSVNLTSGVRTNFSVDDHQDWHFAAIPLATPQSSGNVATIFSLEDQQVKEITYFANALSTKLTVTTPSIFIYDKPLSDPKSVPAVPHPTRYLTEAQLVFTNINSTGRNTEPLSLQLSLGNDNRTSATFTSERAFKYFEPAGRGLMHPLSPAGRNVFIESRESGQPPSTLPDASRGLVAVEVPKSTSFNWTFPNSLTSSRSSFTLLQVFGNFIATEPKRLASTAIHPLHPWTLFSWEEGSVSLYDLSSLSNLKVYHRNLILELTEYLRTGDVKLVETDLEVLVALVRDRYAEAISFNPSDPVDAHIQNFLQGADFDESPTANFIAIPGGWPAVVIEPNSHRLEAFREDVAPSKWLAYDVSTSWPEGATYPHIDPLSSRNSQHQFQPFIESDSGTTPRIYDNAGTILSYGHAIHSGGRWPTLQIRRIEVPTHVGEGPYFVLELDEDLVQNESDEIYLFCKTLILEKYADRQFKPVSKDIANLLGSYSSWRFGRNNNRESSFLDNGWVRVGKIPLSVGKIERLDFTADLTEPVNEVELEKIIFKAVLPSPRELAFQQEIECPLFVQEAIQHQKIINVTVVPGASVEEADVAAEGTFLWKLSQESPDKYQEGSIATGDGISQLKGEAVYGPSNKIEKKSSYSTNVWSLNLPEENSIIARVLGSERKVDAPNLRTLTYYKQNDIYFAETEDFSDPSNFGFRFTSNPLQIPEYSLVLSLSDQEEIDILATILGRYLSSGDESEYQQSVSITKSQEELQLQGIDGFLSAFVAASGQSIMLTWSETDSFKFRYWREIPLESTLAELHIPGSSHTLELEGYTQRFNLESETGVIESYISGYFETPNEDSTQLSTPDSVRIVFLSQEMKRIDSSVPPQEEQLEEFSVSALLTVEIEKNSQHDLESHQPHILTGTVRLQVDPSDRDKLSLMLEDTVYDLTPTQASRRLAETQRTRSGSEIEDRSSKDISFWDDTGTYRSIDLYELSTNTASLISPRFAAWNFGTDCSPQPIPVLIDVDPASHTEDTIIVEGEYSNQSKQLEETTITELEVETEDILDEEIPESLEKINTKENSDSTELSESTSRTFVLAFSSQGTLFVARHGMDTGYLYFKKENQNYLDPTEVLFPEEKIVSADFAGEELIVLTEKKIWGLKAGVLKLYHHDQVDGHDNINICIDPLKRSDSTDRDLVIGRKEHSTYIVRKYKLSEDRRLTQDASAYYPFRAIGWGYYQVKSSGGPFFIYHHTNSLYHFIYGTDNSPRSLRLKIIDELFDSCSSLIFESQSVETGFVLYHLDSRRVEHLHIYKTIGSCNHRHIGRIDLEDDESPTSLSIVKYNTGWIVAVTLEIEGSSDPEPTRLYQFTPITPNGDEFEQRKLPITLRHAQKVDLQATESGEILAATLVENGDSLDVRVDRIAAHRLYFDAVNEQVIPYDRCADGNSASSPQDGFLKLPQMWHLQAAGSQLLSVLPDTWQAVVPERIQAPALSWEEKQGAEAWLIGPLLEINSQRLSIVRSNLILGSLLEGTPDSLRTDTLFALSRNADIGVLLNQTSPSDIEEDLDEKLLKNWLRLLDQRAWKGLTLHRHYNEEGDSILKILPRKRMSIRLSTSGQLLETAADRSSLSDEIWPAPYHLPYDEWQLIDTFQAETTTPDEPSSDGFEYKPGNTEVSALGRGQDLRRFSLDRRSSSTNQYSTIPADARRAELLIGEIAAFHQLPRRRTGYALTESSDGGRPYLPATLEIAHGSGKPGAMISTGITAVIDKKYGSTTTFELRDPLVLAGPTSPMLADLQAISQPVYFKDNELQGLKQIEASWYLNYHPLLIDHETKLPLTRPNSDNLFLTYDEETEEYGFINLNRRIFSLVSVVSSALTERPIFTDTIAENAWRADPSTRSLPIQSREINAGEYATDLYLITRIENIDGEKRAIGGTRSFKPWIYLVKEIEEEDGSKVEVGEVKEFIEVFTELQPSGEYYLWKANSQMEWAEVIKMEIIWRSTEETTLYVYPWSPDENPVKTSEEKETDITSVLAFPISIRSIQGNTDPFNSLVVNEQDYEHLGLTFNNIDGKIAQRESSTSIVREPSGETLLQLSVKYNASFQIQTFSSSDQSLKVCTTLPQGEVLGIESEIVTELLQKK
ncbi:Hypothetical protein PBC10988_3200 [Planctomycetales bacterium 10988]|nr:Hypothetical protein PBC10988_3200 [Planctomycetales bacterium 10988]